MYIWNDLFAYDAKEPEFDSIRYNLNYKQKGKHRSFLTFSGIF